MHARTVAISLSVALLTLCSAPAAFAGWPHERDGAFLGFNLGGGSAGIDVPGVETNREGGLGGNFRVGYAFSPQFAAGLEGNMWTKDVDNETWTFSVGGAALTYFPGATGFFLRGGIGVGTVDYSFDQGGITYSSSDDGFGFLVGTGYEWRLSRKFALGPQFDYSHAKVNDNLSMNYFNFTVGANWYF
jgi:outer membrane protein with beta-barrel domain